MTVVITMRELINGAIVVVCMVGLLILWIARRRNK